MSDKKPKISFKEYLKLLKSGVKVSYLCDDTILGFQKELVEGLGFEEILEIKRKKSDREKKVFELSKANLVLAMARFAYKSGSKVGLITALIEVANVLMDKKLSEQFLKVESGEDNNTVNLELLKYVFPCIDLDAEGDVRYKEIYSDKNKNSLAYEYRYCDGRKIKLIKATKDDIQNKFVAQLSKITKATLEDLAAIGRDLEKIGRLMQEIEIDSAKKPEIKEGLMDITAFMNKFCKLASRKVKMTNNFDIIEYNAKRNNGNKVSFCFEFDEENLLHKIHREVWKYEQVDLKDVEDDELKSELKQERFEQLLEKAIIVDPAYQVKKRMAAGVEKDVQELVNALYVYNMEIFEIFKHVKIDGRETDSNKLTRFVLLAIEVINSHFKYKKHASMTDVDELAATLRNAIYTLGNKLKFDEEQTFKLAVAAGWKHIITDKDGVDKITVGNHFAYTAISNLFTTELKWHFNPEIMKTPIDVEIPQGYAVKMDDFLIMQDGEMEVTLPNGEIDRIVCTKHKKFTGVLAPQIRDNKPVFVMVEDNRYDYTPIDFIAVDAIANLHAVENVYDVESTDGKIDSNILKQINRTKSSVYLEESEIGKEDIPELIVEQDAAIMERVVSDMTSQINKVISHKDNYKFRVFKINGDNNSPGHVHLVLQSIANKKERALARVLYDEHTFYQPIGVKEDDMSVYNKMTPMLCINGGIIVLEK